LLKRFTIIDIGVVAVVGLNVSTSGGTPSRRSRNRRIDSRRRRIDSRRSHNIGRVVEDIVVGLNLSTSWGRRISSWVEIR
jgi:hypothetical protein